MLTHSQSLDRWFDRHGAMAGFILTVLTFFGTVELVVHLISGTVRSI
jgi:hypothetical protein